MDYYLAEDFFITIKNSYLMIMASIAIFKILEKGEQSNEYG